MNIRQRLCAFISLLSVSLAACSQPQETSLPPELTEYIETVTARQPLSRTELRALFTAAQLRLDVIEAITRPAEAKPWYQYRPIFLTEERIRDGVSYWREHAAPLSQAQSQFGVPAEIILAILGVETRFGRYTGGYRALDALMTLGIYYGPRREFFARELEELLLLGNEGVDLLTAQGSYAGALGLPQFMPSNYRQLALDYDQDGQRDLWRSPADAIGSIAYYLWHHGWQAGQPVAVRTALANSMDPAAAIQTADATPTLDNTQLRAMGLIVANLTPPPDARAALVALDGEDESEQWVTYNNFYVITRYNRSVLYAMAVYQLSAALRAAYEAPVTVDADPPPYGDN